MNRKPAWTPGPWRQEPREHLHGFWIFPTEPAEYPLAVVPQNNREEFESNAALIVAAPEMADALEKLIEREEQYLAPDAEPTDPVLRSALNNARTVLARARGEQP